MINSQQESFAKQFGEDLSFIQFYHFVKTKTQIIFQKGIPDTSGLYEMCVNATLMARVVHKDKSGHPKRLHDIVKRYFCNSSITNCVKNA